MTSYLNNKEYNFLISKILDKYKKYKKTGFSTCSNFLNSYQLSIVESFLKSKKIDYHVYSDYTFLDKTIIYFGNYEKFVTKFKISFTGNVTHSQVLGTLFSLGLSDDVIGDIFVEDGFFYYFNLTRLNPFLEECLTTINNQSLKLEQVEDISLISNHFIKKNIIVSSMRIDTIVSRIIGRSRGDINKMISDKLILVNYSYMFSNSFLLKENDILSIRKFGKYKIGSVVGNTKKDNFILEIYKYV